MNARALKFVRHAAIEDHFRQGWMILIPSAPMHHHHYSCELAWICDCPVPGGFTSTRRETHERADNRTQ